MIPIYEPDIREEDIEAVVEQMRSGWVGPGKTVEAFQTAIEERLGDGSRVVVCNSGTSALMLAYWALFGFADRRVVFCPAYGLPAAHNAARMLGHATQLVDISPSTGSINRASLDASLRRHPLFSALVYVMHNGHVPIDLEFAEYECHRRGKPLIVDAAVGLGMPGITRYGDLQILSFSVPKILTTGQGGAVITKDLALHGRLLQLLDQGGGWRQTRIHEHVGGNFRLTDLQAAYGLSQLDRLDATIETRQALRGAYSLSGVPLLLKAVDGWLCIHGPTKAAALCAHLNEHGIGAKQLYQPVRENRPYATGEHYPGAQTFYDEWVYLPSSPQLSSDAVRKIANCIRTWSNGHETTSGMR